METHQTGNEQETILVVDDSPENIDLLAGILKEKYTVKAALNGQKAITIAASKNPPDLILLDVMMPDLDGYEVCRRLKQDHKTRHIPILFVTAMREIEDEAQGLSLGAVDYITKPINPSIVLARVKTHMNLVMHQRHMEKALKALENKLSQISNQTEQLSLAAGSMLSIEDEQEVFDQISKAIVEFSDFKRVVISLFKEATPFRDIIAYGGVEEDVIDTLRRTEIPMKWYDQVFIEENNIGQFSYYIPHTKKHILNPVTVFGTGPEPESENGWHPQDNLFVRMSDDKGHVIGVISVDESKSGLKPSAETVRPLEIFSSLISQIVILKKEQKKRQEIEQQLLQTQKMEAVGTLAGGVAHDFNNILSGILGYSELIEEDLEHSQPVTRERIKRVISASLRGRDLVNQILAFTQSNQRDPILIQVSVIIKEVIQLLRASLPASIRIEHRLDSDSYIMADPINIHRMVINLCANAKDAMSVHGGTLTITLADVNLSTGDVMNFEGVLPGRFLALGVEDTGHGMKPEVINRVMEPFYTTKPPGEGTGMGLSVVHGIVNSLDGFIKITSVPGKGSTFMIFMPVHDHPTGSDHLTLSEIENRDGDERILLVDDERILAEMAKDSLEKFGYDVTIYSSSPEALDHFKDHADHYDLIISDTTMPDMTGDILIQEIRRVRPEIPVILCTGFSEYMDDEKACEMGINAMLYKPIPAEDMVSAVRRIIDGDGDGEHIDR
ncbi:MAG: response regulator [Desulfobacteraceae bacterium]|nr:MAG: response regulator [Desulfobacteraceae bacterium]